MMPKTWTKWSEEEKKYVKNNYGKMTVKEMAEALGRTDRAVRGVIERSDISLMALDRNKQFQWDEEKIAFLRGNYETMSAQAIADAIGASISTVNNKKRQLGLRKQFGLPFTADGYAQQYIDGKKVSLHRYVMEQKLGRPLQKGERVHHVNGNKTDYREENLYLCKSKSHHMLTHSDLERLSYKLVDMGVIGFDHETGKYFINENRIKEDG